MLCHHRRAELLQENAETMGQSRFGERLEWVKTRLRPSDWKKGLIRRPITGLMRRTQQILNIENGLE